MALPTGVAVTQKPLSGRVSAQALVQGNALRHKSLSQCISANPKKRWAHTHGWRARRTADHPRLTPCHLWLALRPQIKNRMMHCGSSWASRQDVLACARQAREQRSRRAGVCTAAFVSWTPPPPSLPSLLLRAWGTDQVCLTWAWGDRGQSSHPNRAIRGHASWRWYPGTCHCFDTQNGAGERAMDL